MVVINFYLELSVFDKLFSIKGGITLSTYVITGGTTGIGQPPANYFCPRAMRCSTLILRAATIWLTYPPLKDARDAIDEGIPPLSGRD